MVEIVPAIIAKDFQELQQKLKLVEPYVSTVQLDVMDGRFVPERTWNKPEDLKKIKTNLNLEAHLMISEPEKEIEKWIISGVKRILVHFEATKQLEEIVKKVKKDGLEIGVVLKLETPVKILDKLQFRSEAIDVIQLMAISKIGYHGHPFDGRVIPKIKSLRRKYPDVKIVVDGGINFQTAKKVAQVGTNILVVGSAIFKSQDIGRAIKELKQMSDD